jgi:glycosyltransferase 2 family protein
MRWRMLLSPLGKYRTLRELFPPVIVGFAFNNILPAHLGEFVRVFVFSRQRSVSGSAVLASVALERICDAVTILSFFAIGLLFAPEPATSIRASAYTAAAAAGVCLLAVVLYVSFTRPFVSLVERCLERLPFVPSGLRRKVAGVLEAGAEGLSAIRDWRLLVWIGLNSIVQWSMNGLLIWISLWSFGIDVPPMAAAVLLGAVAFGVSVPATPGYFGVIQLAFVLGLQVFIDESPQAVPASLYYQMSQYVPVTLLGLYFFNRSGLKVADVQHEAEHEEEELESIGEAAIGETPPAPDNNRNPQVASNCRACWPTVFASSRPSARLPDAWTSATSGKVICLFTGEFPSSWSR